MMRPSIFTLYHSGRRFWLGTGRQAGPEAAINFECVIVYLYTS